LPSHAVAGVKAPQEVSAEPLPRGSECILLVEDESAILRMATVMLERQGYTVLAASRPSEAIRLATDHPGDIQMLMTDVVMPEMDGRELATRVRAQYPAIKVLFMSGYMANTLSHRSILEEGSHFIGKPFSMNELWAEVRRTLGAGE